MKVFVVDNVHLYKDKQGNYYSATLYDYEFLLRYLEVFDEVRFAGKVRSVEAAKGKQLKKVSGENVEILELPWYQGIREMLHVLPQLFHIYKKSCDGVDCCIFRLSQIESYFVYLFGKPSRMPFGIEVVNDPNTFTINKVFKKLNVCMLKKMARKAATASYVTEYTLQKLYPTNNNAFVTHYSSIELDESDIRKSPKQYMLGSKVKIVHVSNAINDDVKGHSTAIKTVKEIVDRGIDVSMDFIGDGKKVDEFQNEVNALGLENHIHFIGRIRNKKELLEKLDTYTLMLLPTRMEGLPRTIIEACAVGLPCLSTPIAGIPELIESQYLYDPDDYCGFADKIEYLLCNPAELQEMSEKNIQKAYFYTSGILRTRRREMYTHLKETVSNS